MPQSIILKVAGRVTDPNNLGSLPDGALSEAENIYIDSKDIAEPRRGFGLYAEEFGISTDRTKQLLLYQDRILRHYGSTLSYDSATGSGPFTDYATGVSEVEDGIKIKGAELNGNFYITSLTGIKKLDQVDTELQHAGGVKALDLEASLSGATSGGFLEGDNQVGYRLVWGYNDRNQNLILGTPSERVVIANTGTDSDTVDLSFSVPENVTVNHFYQIYRTTLSGASGVDPGDEMALVFEDNPTSDEITARVVEITDVTPESFRGDELYTNANQQGILQANEIPPFAKDIAVYKNSMFFANTKTKHRLDLAMLSSLDFSNGDEITFTCGDDSFSVTFSDSEEDATNGVCLFDTSDTPAQNVDATARSFIRAINRNSANTFLNIFYLSGPDDVPGLFLLESRTLNDITFSLTASSSVAGENFNPTIPTSGTSLASDNEELPNRIYYSKTQQPDAVPLVNNFDVGARNSKIIRIIALRDSLFIFKQDGIYRAIGDATSGLQVSLFDNSARILAGESPAVGNNQIFLFTDQGIIRVSDTGVDIISGNIEDQLQGQNSSRYENFNSATFGLFYTTARRYYLWVLDSESDVYASVGYVYNVFTNAWTTFPGSKTCGIVGADDKLYLGAGDINQLEQERKTFDYTDYADRSYDTILGSFDGTSLVVNSTTNMNVGDIVTQKVYLNAQKFNALLAKLDEDPAIPDSDFFSTLSTQTKADLRTNVSDLASKLDLAGLEFTNYHSSLSLGDTPSDIQSDFNTIIGLLNTDSVVADNDYQTSASTNTLETVILSIDTDTSTIEVELEYNWDLASITYYNRIATKVTWAPVHAGDASIFKHFREGNLLFSDIASNVVDLSFRSDIQRDYETVPFESDSTGAWGVFEWGQEPWGGNSAPRAFRTYVPREKQRCRFLEPKFEHKRAYESYKLVGLSLTVDPMTERVGR